jgi:RimJ/RimL family protein N-acetyltransferase
MKSSDINQTYLSWLNDKEHMKFSNQKYFQHTKESSLVYLEKFEETNNIFFGIFKKNDEMIGTLTAYYDIFNRNANLGILISPNKKGRGYGKEVFKLTLNRLPDFINLHKISSGTCELNIGMLNIFKSSGMSQEYVVPKEFLYEGKYYDNIFFAKYI